MNLAESGFEDFNESFVNGTKNMPRKSFNRRLTAVEPLERRLLLFNGFNPTVTLETNLGDIEFELLEDDAPGTVENFLTYVNDGDYLDSFFHRLVPGFVIQGGGFSASDEFFLTQDDIDACANSTSGVTLCELGRIDADSFDIVPADAPIVNEPGVSNTLGTVAMAKLGGNPDSATNQFFINLQDNGPNLDNQNGGFTVFARVNDLTTVNRIASLGDRNISSVFTNPAQARLQATTDLPFESTADGQRLVLIEDITGTSLVHGTVYSDNNSNGVLDGAEPGQSAVVVFDDVNGNGVPDTGELQTTTDSNGDYHLTFPGEYDYNIAIVERAGTVATSAENVFGSLEIGQSTINVDFGVRLNAVVGWHNPSIAEDVNGDGIVAPIDALQVINELNSRVVSNGLNGELQSPSNPPPDPLFLPDVDNDGIVAPLDAILVINVLNGSTPTAALSATAVAFAEGETDDSDDENGLDSAMIDEIFAQ